VVLAAMVAVIAVLVVVALRFQGDGEPKAAAAPEPAPTQQFKPTPHHLVVESLGIDAPVVTISMSEDRALDPPADPQRVGWWDGSAKPGAATGQTIVTGHTVHTGGGQLDHLGDLERGAEVMLGKHRYRATEVVTYTKAEVAQNNVELFGQDRPRNRLVLITCDDWTGSEYLTNVFVFAKPIGTGPSAA